MRKQSVFEYFHHLVMLRNLFKKSWTLSWIHVGAKNQSRLNFSIKFHLKYANKFLRYPTKARHIISHNQ